MLFPSESQARQGRRPGRLSGIPGLPRTPHHAAMQPGTAAQFLDRGAGGGPGGPGVPSATLRDVTGDATDDTAAVAALVDGLVGARDAARALTGREPLGVRAVEPAPGRRGYVVAFEGPAFLCLDGRLRAEPDGRRAREAASASLLWEDVERLVDAEALRDLAADAGRVLALGHDPGGILTSVGAVAARALELAAWREEPVRALASLPDLDGGVALQERLVGAYARFMRVSEPLVAVQDELDPDLREALRDLEGAAARAGAGQRLADLLAAAMPACQEGAGEMLAAHLTRLRPEAP